VEKELTDLRPKTRIGQSLPVRLRLLSASVLGVLLVLAPLAARADAAASDYGSPLYLGGTGSGVVTGSFKLTTSAGPGAPTAAPGATVLPGGSMPLSPSSYTYVYTYLGADGESAPSPTAQVNLTSGNQQVELTFPPSPASATKIRLYRQRSGLFNFVDELAPTTSTHIDNASDPPSATVLPQSQNRPAGGFGSPPTCGLTNCGYTEFAPAAYLGVSNNSPMSAAATPNFAKGWVVDVAGPVSFAAGSWTFNVKYKSGVWGSIPTQYGIAHLVVGLWKVTTSGGTVTSSTQLINPGAAGEETSTNLINASNSIQTVAKTVSLPSFSLGAGEHLYVQFWRRQTQAYNTTNAAARVLTLYAYDGATGITHPAADDAAPSAFSITSPASGAAIKNGYSLQSNPSDPTPGSGLASVEYFYCLPLADCTLALNRTSIGSSTSPPYSVAWAGQPADGTYQLVTVATDNVGNTTATAVVPVTVDNTPPDTTLTSTPSDPSNGSPSFGFSSADPGTFECSLDGSPFAACSSPHALTGLASGSHTLQVRAVDLAGNADASPASHTWTVDATAPTASVTSSPATPSGSATAAFSFTASEPATFACRLDGAPYAACTSPRSLSGLADGSHTFEVRATDGVGNTGSASYTWTVDTTAPTVTIGSAPSNLANTKTASFSFTASEAATFECRLDGAVYAACSSPHSAAGLAEGSHTFDVRATDAVGHVGSASYTWTVDTLAPSTPALDQPAAAAPTSSLRLTALYTGPEPGSRGYVEFRVCTDEACANVVASGPSAEVAAGAVASWSINVALADGTYFWQARAVDLAGNASGWARIWNFTRDTVRPAAPGGFTGVVAADGLTLRWTAPPDDDQIGNYVVYVDGKQWRVLGEVTYEVKVGPFDAGDTRSFTVSAVDRAGNEGPQTTPLVGVPDVVGLSVPAAKDAIETRGLVLDELRTVHAEGTPAFVVAQTPAAPGLAPKGSAVDVVVGTAPTTEPQPLVEISEGSVCGTRGDLKLQVRLSERATVTLNILSARSKRLVTKRLGVRPPGLTNHRLKLKTLSRPGRYRLVVTAKAFGRSGRDTLTLTVTRSKARSARTGC
jgi:hypothetical protein